MMDAAASREAFELLRDHWRTGRRLVGLPDRLRPRTRRDGYAIQAWLGAGRPDAVRGWKLAATSRAGQAHIGVDGPLAGRLPADRVVEDGATLPLGTSLMRVAEIEFVFRLGRDLPARTAPYGVDDAMAAVDALHLGIELPDSRYSDFVTAGAPQLLADAACADRFVLGPAAPPDWRALDLSRHPVRGIVAGRFAREGSGGNVLGDPRIALAWLANELGAIGSGLRAGEIVTTGTCVPPLEIVPGDVVLGDFGPLGQVSVRIAPEP